MQPYACSRAEHDRDRSEITGHGLAKRCLPKVGHDFPAAASSPGLTEFLRLKLECGLSLERVARALTKYAALSALDESEFAARLYAPGANGQ